MKPTRALRILYHHRTQGRGAEGVHIVSIVRALEGMGHHVTVLSPPGVDPLASAGDAPVDKSNVKTTGFQSVWKWMSRNLPNALFELAEIAYNVPAARRLEAELATGRYDLVYERYAFYLLAGAFKASRHNVPFVLEANEVSGIADRARPQTFAWLCGRFERALFKRCSAILTVSSHLRGMALARGGIAPEAVRVVPNAIDVEKFAAATKDKALATRLGLDGRTVMAVAGWFDKWDRLDFLMEATRRLTADVPSASLLVIGDGPVLAAARDKAHALGVADRIVFAGAVPRSEVLRYLGLADVAVLPHSNQFGSPVVMFEFMGLKVPVVAPRLPPIEDVHRHGDTALLFTPLDLDSFCSELGRALTSAPLRREMADRAYAKLIAEHTWTRNAEQILEGAGLA